jgi:outer membrane lipoprotein carrier protein
MTAWIVAGIAALATAGGSATSVATPMDAAKVVARVQKRYDQTSDLRARFSQSLTHATFGRTTRSDGEVLIKKPGKMRWNYEKPEVQMYLAAGAVLWLYQPEDKQAIKQDLKTSSLPAAVAFLMGKGRLTDEFDVSLANKVPAAAPQGAATDQILSLRPKQGRGQGQYKSIFFVVDPQTDLVKQSVLVDAQGNVNSIVFSDMKTNTRLADTLFRWSPPPGIKIVDAAAAATASSPTTSGTAPATGGTDSRRKP